MTTVEVHIELGSDLLLVGSLRRQRARHPETVTFEYAASWLEHPKAFSLEPSLRLTPGPFSPAGGQPLFGAIGDSAPDRWGKGLMRQAERLNANLEARPVRTLTDLDYLLGVTDSSRMGALRFRAANGPFLSQDDPGVPALVDLPRLLAVTERALRNEPLPGDLRQILAPGSSLGGARPKASFKDNDGSLSIAKFPKQGDKYSIERWEEIALRLAEDAAIETPNHRLIQVGGRPVLLSKRFDRTGDGRIPFLSAMSLTGAVDGVRGSYPEMADVLVQHGADARTDAARLFRRLTFNVLVSNVDDHQRNHGFLWQGKRGWSLSPTYDLNPTPVDLSPRILSTNISPDDGTCSLDLVIESAGYFGLNDQKATEIIRQVAKAVSAWRHVADKVGAPHSEVTRMQSAFEHEDLKAALA